MYNLKDTILAISSGKGQGCRKIIRCSGGESINALSGLLGGCVVTKHRAVTGVEIPICNSLSIAACLYVFPGPGSYTGEDICELHFFAGEEVVELVYQRLLDFGLREALGGEFTYRAYVNGKLDLSQAEAVAEIVAGSNQYQLAAAQKLLSGALSSKVSQISDRIIELLSLIEAGLDFSTEDIEIISAASAVALAKNIGGLLDELVAGSISFEQIIEADSVAAAGVANAGKSSLVNAILGFERSIVSDEAGATRDVLEHWLRLENCGCVVFDCAGLVAEPRGLLEGLADAGAVEALRNATFVIFCVDITSENHGMDAEILRRLGRDVAIFAATKCDLVSEEKLRERLDVLKSEFGVDFLVTSSKSSVGVAEIKSRLQDMIISRTSASAEASGRVAIMQRHMQAVKDASEDIGNAVGELEKDSFETAAMFLRDGLTAISSLKTEHVDELILDKIFSSFCVGK